MESATNATGSPRVTVAFVVLSFVLLLSAVPIVPYARQSPTIDDDLTRYTVRVSLLYYAAAVCLLLLRRADAARLPWTLGWVAYLVHLYVAFQLYHHGSHAEAVQHTEDVTGFGPGIYVSHFFTLVWTLDVASWWLWPASYARRATWITGFVHGFMAFIVFNAMVIYETGPIRWAGLALFALFGVLLARLWFRRAGSVSDRS
jgi:hypothetical protein